MNLPLCAVASVVLLLVVGCGGSDTGVAPKSGVTNEQKCLQLGTDWAVPADDLRGSVLMGDLDQFGRIRASVDDLARQLRAARCEQELVAEALKAQAGMATVEEEIASCVQERGTTEIGGQESCVAARARWDVEVEPSVLRVRDLVASKRDPDGVRLSIRDVCARLGAVLPVDLPEADKSVQIATLGEVGELHARADATTQERLSRLLSQVSYLASGFDPAETAERYEIELKTVELLCSEAGIRMEPSARDSL